jgi:hypothetical protein
MAEAVRLMSSIKRNRFRFYLYNNDSGEFREIKNGMFCRRTESEIDFPDDHLISRRHCLFTVGQNGVYVEDLGSTNLSRVKSVPLTPQKRGRLLLNDVLEVGTQRLILTNQNKYPPSNVKDPERTRVYKALRRNDGSLTSFVTALITKQTLVRVNRRVFQTLRVKTVVKTFKRQPQGTSRVGVFAVSACLIAMTIVGLYSAGMFEGLQEKLRVLAAIGPAPIERQAQSD